MTRLSLILKNFYNPAKQSWDYKFKYVHWNQVESLQVFNIKLPVKAEEVNQSSQQYQDYLRC
jgi:hypothetical protein